MTTDEGSAAQPIDDSASLAEIEASTPGATAKTPWHFPYKAW